MKIFIGMCLIIIGIGLIYLHIVGPITVYNEEQLFRAVGKYKYKKRIIIARSFNVTKNLEIPKNISLVFLPGVHLGVEYYAQITLYSPETITQKKLRKHSLVYPDWWGEAK
jgi:hypothetical protein